MCFFFQAEDGIRDSVASRGLGDVYKRQSETKALLSEGTEDSLGPPGNYRETVSSACKQAAQSLGE